VLSGSRSLVVLIVDDDLGDVMLVREALEGLGVPREIHVARDGDEALAFLRREGDHAGAPRPDIVLLDLNMPRVGGHEVLTLVKADEELKSIPVVVFTTSTAVEDIRASYASHANAYVTKPVALDELFAAVRHIDTFFGGIACLPTRG